MMRKYQRLLTILLCLAMLATMGAAATEATCEHTNTETYTVWTDVTYAENDNDTHWKIGTMYEVTECKDCGERLSTGEMQTNASEEEAHFFNWDPYCDYCNYENPCTHVNKTEYSFFGQDTVYEPYDAKQHLAKGSLYDCVACADCKIELETVLRDGNAEELQNHSFEDDGRCLYCKVERSEEVCQHVNTEPDEPFFIMEKTEYVCIDDENHQATGIKLTIVRCVDCGEPTDNVEEEASEIQAHSSNAEGTACQYCQYPYDQAEPTPEATPEITPVPTVKPTTAPTVEPTTAPTVEPTTAPTVKPTTAPTVEPTIEPTVEPTVEPTIEPTAKPTQKPVVIVPQQPVVQQPAVEEPEEEEKEEAAEEQTAPVQTVVDVTALEEKPVVEAMAEVMAQLEEKAADAAVEIVNLDKVVTEEEKQVLENLDAMEQVFVLLSALGHEEAVQAILADEEAAIEISQEAQDVLEIVTQRLNNMDETERAEFEATLMENFPVESVEIDGETYEYFAIELKITQGEETHIERYGFRYDEEKEEWIFMQLEEASEEAEEETEE